MDMKKYILFCIAILFAITLYAQPSKITYQGVLSDDSGNLINGTRNLIFKIYNHINAGDLLKTVTHNNVTITNGLFTVELDVSLVNFAQELWLEIVVGTTTLTPRIAFNATGYALASSGTSGSISSGGNSLGTDMILGTNDNYGLILETNNTNRIQISNAGTVSIPSLSTAGVVHNNVNGALSTSLIVNADVDANAGISDSKLSTISTAGKVANSATTATSANDASTIVLRDASGNFTAGTITATLNGNASSATTTTNFSGSLSGDISGTQSATAIGAGKVTNTMLAGSIDDTKLNTIASAGKVSNSATTATSTSSANTIVARDASNNFAVNMITINGTITNSTDAVTKAYLDQQVLLGIVLKNPANVISFSNITLSGLPTIDGVTLTANDIVLLIGQTDKKENGLWVASSGAWSRTSDFSSGVANKAYVLVLNGTDNKGSSWICNTPTATIGTDEITFAQFSLPGQTSASNVGTGEGHIFKDKSGINLNLKTIKAGSYITVTNNTNDITISTDAVSTNTASKIVSRDASGNFSAGTITANLAGNASTATSTANFSGNLVGDVTGNQTATVVSTVGGQTAANVAAATVLINNATSNNTPSTLVERDASGNFATNSISSNTLAIGTATPSNSAALEISSTTKGFLLPRMTQDQRNAITAVEGLVVFNTVTKKPNYYNGTEWMNFDGTSATIVSVGDTYRGGKVAYILQEGDAGYDPNVQHGFIASLSDNGGINIKWGCNNSSISGADGTAISTGNQNTIDIEAGCPDAGIAADVCANLVSGGYDDWYLPSRDELNKLYLNRAIIGNFTTNIYWSSSENTANNAYGQNFNDGTISTLNKNNNNYVRAIRSF